MHVRMYDIVNCSITVSCSCTGKSHADMIRIKDKGGRISGSSKIANEPFVVCGRRTTRNSLECMTPGRNQQLYQ